MEELHATEKTPETNTTCSTSNMMEAEENTPRSSSNEAGSCSGDAVESKDKPLEEDNDTFSLITWNVGGLDGREQLERATALCCFLTKYSPDVAFFQVLIKPYVRFLHKSLAEEYEFIEGGKERYFTVMLLKKSRIKLLTRETVAFPTSHTLRNLLVAKVLFRGQKLCLMTSHLESGEANAAERMKQLQLVMKRMSTEKDDVTVLFGGDTNLRDAEMAGVDLPSVVCDVWEQLGEPDLCCYTWDTRANTNSDVRPKCYFRFDRVYLRRATVEGVLRLEPDSMTLVGLEKLKSGQFISDHWGVYCTFSAEPKSTKK